MSKLIVFASVLGLVAGCASTPSSADEPLVRVVPVRSIAADRLAAELVKQANLRGGDPVALTIDPRTNSIVVSCAKGHEEELPAILRRIEELDESTQSKWTGTGTTCHGHQIWSKEVVLQFAVASDVADALTELMEASLRAVEARGCTLPVPGTQAGPAARSATDARVVADPQTNTVTVTSSDVAELAQVVELIARLDEDSAPKQ